MVDSSGLVIEIKLKLFQCTPASSDTADKKIGPRIQYWKSVRKSVDIFQKLQLKSIKL